MPNSTFRIMTAAFTRHISPETALRQITKSMVAEWPVDSAWSDEVMQLVESDKYYEVAFRLTQKLAELDQQLINRLIEVWQTRSHLRRLTTISELRAAAHRREQYGAYEFLLSHFSDRMERLASMVASRPS